MKKVLLIAAGTLVVGGLVAIFVYKTIFSAKITITAAPYNAHIYLNGKEVQNRKANQVRPGDYTIIVERGGFDGEERQITVKRNDNASVTFALLPSDGDYKWYSEHPEDSLILDSVMSARSIEREEQITARFPVLNALPYKTNFFILSLFALPSDDNPKITFQLTIFEIPRDGLYATPEKLADYTKTSREWLSKQGLAEADYDIVPGNDFIEND